MYTRLKQNWSSVHWPQYILNLSYACCLHYMHNKFHSTYEHFIRNLIELNDFCDHYRQTDSLLVHNQCNITYINFYIDSSNLTMLKCTSESLGRNVWHFEYPLKNKLDPIHNKINIVRGTVIYNEYIRFEFNWKHSLDSSILLKVLLHKLLCIKNSFLFSCRKILFLILWKSIQYVAQ